MHMHTQARRAFGNGVTFTSLGENALGNHIPELFQGNIGILGSILTAMDINTVLWLCALKVWGRENITR